MSIPTFLLPSTSSTATVDLNKYRTIASSELVPLVEELSTLTDQFGEQVDSRLTESETDFLLAFQAHMVTVNGDLDGLRKRADTTEADQRREERIVVLKREVEWFKTECVRLNDTVKSKNRDNRKLIDKLNGMNEELKFLKNLVHKSAHQVRRVPSAAESGRLASESARNTPQLKLETPAIVDQDLLEKAEILVEKEKAMHAYLDKELVRVQKQLRQTEQRESAETESSWLLDLFESLATQPKERLTRTDKIELVTRLLNDEKVLNALLAVSSSSSSSGTN